MRSLLDGYARLLIRARQRVGGAVRSAEPIQLLSTYPRRHGAKKLQRVGPPHERQEHGLERTRGAHRRLVAQHAEEFLVDQARLQAERWIVVRHWSSVTA